MARSDDAGASRRTVLAGGGRTALWRRAKEDEEIRYEDAGSGRTERRTERKTGVGKGVRTGSFGQRKGRAVP